ncbi:betaine aldehyde dehydrogenase-like [Penaeus monodon]|uniref:betaine aldehyde dehydrogenase-like n=1 Tax=Penaeus monodon TaxID=6687 RepID=UPI0018A7BEBD|nr:betaine aldehyde dehydrogenase-like [Penaeus monodon]
MNRNEGAPNFPPTIVTNVKDDMDIQREETFGPTITIVKFKQEDEAIYHANDTIYGLSSSVWTSDLAKAERFVRAKRCGQCLRQRRHGDRRQFRPALRRGGKQSGIGRYKSGVGLHKNSATSSPSWSTRQEGQRRTLVPLHQGEIPGNLETFGRLGGRSGDPSTTQGEEPVALSCGPVSGSAHPSDRRPPAKGISGAHSL